MICPNNSNGQQCKSQCVEELNICYKTEAANEGPKSSLKGLRFQIQSEDLCELQACLGFPCTSEISGSWMTRSERVNIYRTKCILPTKVGFFGPEQSQISDLCEEKPSSVSLPTKR